MNTINHGHRGWLAHGSWREQNETRLRTLYRLVLVKGGRPEIVVDDVEWMTIRVLCEDWGDFLTEPRTVAHMIHLMKGVDERDEELRDALHILFEKGIKGQK